MKHRSILKLIAMLALLTFSGAQAAEKVSVSFFSWPGYGFWFIAKEKGLAPDLELDLQIIEDPYESFGQLAAGKLDVTSSTVEYGPIAADSGVPVKLVTYTNLSYGTDRLIMSEDIKEASDLKGKTVAVLEGGLTQIFMGIWLEDNGVKFDEVEYANLIMDDAVAAMVSGKVAGGEFWEPFGTVVLDSLKGTHVVATSIEPYWLKTGLLADGMYMSDKFMENPELAAKTMKAYWDAVAWWKENPEEGNKIIAEGLSFELADVESVIGTTGEPNEGGLAVLDVGAAKKFMGVEEGEPPFDLKNGQITEVWDLTTEWWKKFEMVTGDPKFEDGVDTTVISAQ
ncbi:MAG: ABC transporter [Verrucomicrobiales bacterium]|nr:ABC transporter [Verrucomicrobiales bacterium]